MSDEFYIRIRGQVQGPFTQERLVSLARRQRFTRVHQVSTDKENWQPASKFPDLFPPPPEMKRRQVPVEVSEASASESSGYELAIEPQQATAGELASAETVSADTAKEWFYVHHGREEEYGPVSVSELQDLAGFGQLQRNDYVWKAGMPEWIGAEQHPDIFANAVHAQGQISQEQEYVTADQPLGQQGERSPLAIISFILALAGATILTFFGSIGAIICGHLALRQIRREGLQGRGFALAGLIIGYVTVALTILTLFIVLCVLIFQEL